MLWSDMHFSTPFSNTGNPTFRLIVVFVSNNSLMVVMLDLVLCKKLDTGIRTPTAERVVVRNVVALKKIRTILIQIHRQWYFVRMFTEADVELTT